jgi:hypothetical protein
LLTRKKASVTPYRFLEVVDRNNNNQYGIIHPLASGKWTSATAGREGFCQFSQWCELTLVAIGSSASGLSPAFAHGRILVIALHFPGMGV